MLNGGRGKAVRETRDGMGDGEAKESENLMRVQQQLGNRCTNGYANSAAHLQGTPSATIICDDYINARGPNNLTKPCERCYIIFVPRWSRQHRENFTLVCKILPKETKLFHSKRALKTSQHNNNITNSFASLKASMLEYLQLLQFIVLFYLFQ